MGSIKAFFSDLWGFLRKTSGIWKILGIALVVLVVLGEAAALIHQDAANDRLRERIGQVEEIRDGLLAQYADVKFAKDSLAALQEAADSLDGEVVAGVRVVTEVDTLRVPVASARTDTQADSTRVASVTDTTTLGVEVTFTAEAPPFPLPLRLGYNVIVPSFEPQVGFVETPEGYAAVVDWQGMRYRVENSFFRPETPSVARRLSLFGRGRVAVTPTSTLHHLDLFGGIEYSYNEETQIRMGPGLFNGQPYIAVEGQKNFVSFSMPSWGDWLPF